MNVIRQAGNKEPNGSSTLHINELAGQPSAEVAALQQALAAVKDKLRRYARRIADMPKDPTPEEQAAFASVRAEISGRIRSLETQLATAAVPVVKATRLRALHERLTRTQVADLVDGLGRHGATEALRTLLVELVESATVVERRPHSHRVWLRAQVQWVPDVQQLLGVGLLQLAEPEAGPVLPTSAELHRARVRRYRQRQHERGLSLSASAATMSLSDSESPVALSASAETTAVQTGAGEELESGAQAGQPPRAKAAVWVGMT